MHIKILNLEALSYEQLTDLDRSLSKVSKEVRQTIREENPGQPLSDSERALAVKSQFLTKVRTIVSERIDQFAQTVDLKEVI